MKKLIFTFLFSVTFLWSYPKTFVFDQVQPKDTCVELLLQNVANVANAVSPFRGEVKFHYITLKFSGSDSLYEIQSYDYSGILTYIYNQNIVGVYIFEDHKFFLDVSLSSLFEVQGKKTRIRYGSFYLNNLNNMNNISFNDCYIYWLFDKNNGYFDFLYRWDEKVFRAWYDLNLNKNCFCNYKNLTIDYIEQESEDDD